MLVQCVHFSFAFEASAQVVLSAFTTDCNEGT